MTDITVLLDGWALAYEPNSPAAIHLQTLLDYWPPGIRAIVALPAQPLENIPNNVESRVLDTPATASWRLRWEQLTLPTLAKKTNTQIIHLTSGTAALFGTCPSLLSPTGHVLPAPLVEPGSVLRSEPARYIALAYRLRAALLEGSLGRLHGILWPADMPNPESGMPIYRLPVSIPKVFWEGSSGIPGLDDLDLPEDFVLYHGAGEENALHMVVESWGWVNHALGETTRLLAAGLDGAARNHLAELAAENDIAGSVHILPEIPLAKLAEIYRRSRALFHPAAISPWGDPLHLALACAKPVVAVESSRADARLGPAAYLAPPKGRALGAALVTILVEDEIAQALSEEAKKRSAAWKTAEEKFQINLSEVYKNVASRRALSASE